MFHSAVLGPELDGDGAYAGVALLAVLSLLLMDGDRRRCLVLMTVTDVLKTLTALTVRVNWGWLEEDAAFRGARVQ